MNTPQKPSLEAFSDALQDQDIRTIQIIHIALAMGVLLFTVVVFVLFLTVSSESEPAGSELIWLLTILQLVVAGSIYFVARIVFKRQLAAVAASGTKDSLGYVGSIRTAMIVRLALLEGAALYGLVVCMLAVLNGAMNANPVYWINLAGVVAMLLFVSWNFPTRESIVEIYKTRILTV